MKWIVILFLVVMSFSFVSAIPNDAQNTIDFTYEVSGFDNSTANVNNSQYLQGLTPEQVADLYTETDPYWLANYSNFLTISAWNNTGLIRDWNATGFIKDWSYLSGGSINGTAINVTGIWLNNNLIQDWSEVNYTGGAGSSVTIGSQYQVPFTNAGGDDFDYEGNFIYDSSKTKLNVGNTFVRTFQNTTEYINYGFDDDYALLSSDSSWTYYGSNENINSTDGKLVLVDLEPYAVYNHDYIYQDDTPPTPNYQVEMNMTWGWNSNAQTNSLYGRWLDANNYYRLAYRIVREVSGGGDLYIYKVEGGVETQLATIDDGFDHGTEGTQSYILKFELDGTTLKGYVNGIEMISTTDGNLTQKGYVGFGVRDTLNLIANENWTADDFKVYNVNAIGQVGTDGDYDWFNVRNNIPIQRFTSTGIEYLNGKSLTFQDTSTRYETEIYQGINDILRIDGTATQFADRVYLGSNPKLEIRSYTYGDELYDELFNENDLDPFGTDSPYFNAVYILTSDHTYTEDGLLKWDTPDGSSGSAVDTMFEFNGEMSTNNYSVEIDVGSVWASTNYAGGGVNGRIQDGSNYWGCRIIVVRSASGGNTLQLYNRISGSLTVENSTTVNANPNTPEVGQVKVTFDGDQISCSWNGEELLTLTDSRLENEIGVGFWVGQSRYNTFPGSFVDNWKAYTSGEYAKIGTQTGHAIRFFTNNTEWWEIGTDGTLTSIFDTPIVTGTTIIDSNEITVDKITATTTDPLMMVYTPTNFDRIKRLDSLVPADKKGLNFWYDSSDPDNLQAWNSLTGDTYTIPMKKGDKVTGTEIKDGYYYDYQLDQYYKLETKSVEVDITKEIEQKILDRYLKEITECKIQKKDTCNIKMEVRTYVSENEATK